MMTTIPPAPSLRPWDTWEGASLDEPIQACFRGCVYYFHDRRNAWNYTTSQRYPNYHAFHPTMLAARMAIEKRRVQGSQWRIKELPALVVEGDSHALVVVEINTDTPFSNFTTGMPEPWTLEGAGKVFDSCVKNHVMRFITSKGAMPPVEGPLEHYRSRSVGSKDRNVLSWIGSPLEISATSLHLILTRWSRSLENDHQPDPKDLLVSTVS